ncbi:MAG: hypothetical protein M1817_004406 [Caeruleum heppii]|nr:MAG: hypothetical protein M1817_004406 [Caeruleum heppii]
MSFKTRVRDLAWIRANMDCRAKLELLLLSRSPSVVSVALQLPPSEAENLPNGRLIDKFPSTTTLWLILRKFESGAAAGSRIRNFTARGVPRTSGGDSGAGRLYHEAPVIQVMGREFSSTTELQKSLAQLGFNGGSTLLRLNFKPTDTPLEAAMKEMEQYFKDLEDPVGTGAHSRGTAEGESAPAADQQVADDNIMTVDSLPEPSGAKESTGEVKDEVKPVGEQLDQIESQAPKVQLAEPIVGPAQRPMVVFAPPTNPVPHAASQSFNDADYEPTVDHAKMHQSRLSLSARNKRLPSEAELKAAEASTDQKLAKIEEVEIKIRYPDQSQVVSKFSATDTAATLYEFVASTLENPQTAFFLTYVSPKGPKAVPKDGQTHVQKRLIGDLGFTGRMLLNFTWDQSAGTSASPGPVLKREYAAKATEIQVQDVQALEGTTGNTQDTTIREEGKGDRKSGSVGGGKRGVPKWLKLPGRK